MDEYYRRHSLKPTNTETESDQKKVIWQLIHYRYSVACQRYYRLTGETTPARTVEALQKHWKETGRRTPPEDLYSVPETKLLEQRWDSSFNAYFILSCPGEAFNNLLSTIESQWGPCCRDLMS